MLVIVDYSWLYLLVIVDYSWLYLLVIEFVYCWLQWSVIIACLLLVIWE